MDQKTAAARGGSASRDRSCGAPGTTDPRPVRRPRRSEPERGSASPSLPRRTSVAVPARRGRQRTAGSTGRRQARAHRRGTPAWAAGSSATTAVSLLGRVPGYRRPPEEVDAYAAAWETNNVISAAGDGPVWAVLGDSAGQGVGAWAYDRGWVGLVRDRVLPDHRLVNLPQWGARTRDVVHEQWPQAIGLLPDVVTRRRRPQRRLGDLALAMAAAHRGAGRVPSRRRRRGYRRTGRGRAEDHPGERAPREPGPGVAVAFVADIWSDTGPPYRGLHADGTHPNERGHARWADAVVKALGRPVPGDAGNRAVSIGE
jgi:lysophospholipase L1-like esterase